MPTDPVCGETFTEEEAESLGAENLEVGGKRVWFCGPYCKRMYEEDPAAYAAAHAGKRANGSR